MDDQVFVEVDRYLDGLFGPADPALTAALDRSAREGLPSIAVSPNQGRLLHVLALCRGVRSILEIGTLGGYSTTWLARALPPDGRLTSLELSERHAQVARQNLADAGVADRVEIVVGPAAESLRMLADDGAGPFDLVFIDADKEPYAEYLELTLRLAAPGTLMIADNVVRDGAVARQTDDPSIAGLRRFNAAFAAHERITGSFVQTVGDRGHDGMAIGVVR